MRYILFLLFPCMIFAQETTLVGDVNCDGEINSEDASLILQYVTNAVDSLPCESNMTGLTPDQLQEMIELINAQFNSVPSNGISMLYPDGFEGEVVIFDLNEDGYTVPTGKTLYITSIFSSGMIDIELTDNNETSTIVGTMNYDGTESGRKSLHAPIILSEGKTIYASYNNASINGFLVESVVEPIVWSGSYDVPEGKVLYVTHVYDDLEVDEILISYGAGSYWEIGQPIIVSAGSNVDGELFNGYLVDEGYFSFDNSTLSSGNNNLAAGSSGVDWEFPQGYYGQPITQEINEDSSYTVPEGQNLYITEMHSPANYIIVQINDKTIGKSYYDDGHSSNFPLILKAGDTIIASSAFSTIFNGILIEESALLSPITQEINEDSSYTVPEGQNLYITEMHSPANYIIVQINDKTIGKSYYDDGHSSNFPLILKAGDTIIASSAFSTTFNGYLADENYFSSTSTSSVSNANENYVLLNSDQYNLSVNFDASLGTLAIGAQITETSILNSYLYKGLTCNVYDNNNILLNSTGVFNHPSQSTNWSLGLDLENGDIIHIHIICMSSLGMIVIDESFTVSE